MLNLRGHHLICLHFFKGEGYDSGFVRNLTEIMAGVYGRGINVCSGTDDVCGSCPHLKDDSCRYSETADKEIREMDEAALKLLNVESGTIIEWDIIRKRLQGIFDAWYAKYCNSCGWKRACEKNSSFQKLKNSHP